MISCTRRFRGHSCTNVHRNKCAHAQTLMWSQVPFEPRSVLLRRLLQPPPPPRLLPVSNQGKGSNVIPFFLHALGVNLRARACIWLHALATQACPNASGGVWCAFSASILACSAASACTMTMMGQTDVLNSMYTLVIHIIYTIWVGKCMDEKRMDKGGQGRA